MEVCQTLRFNVPDFVRCPQAMDRQLENGELALLYHAVAVIINRIVRGFLGRRKADRAKAKRTLFKRQMRAATRINSLLRSFLARRRVQHLRDNMVRELIRSLSATHIQRIGRGYVARRDYRIMLRTAKANDIQRAFRGHLGRKAARMERDRLEEVRRRHAAATKIQVRPCKEQGAGVHPR